MVQSLVQPFVLPAVVSGSQGKSVTVTVYYSHCTILQSYAGGNYLFEHVRKKARNSLPPALSKVIRKHDL